MSVFAGASIDLSKAENSYFVITSDLAMTNVTYGSTLSLKAGGNVLLGGNVKGKESLTVFS